jgi:hypothetical protein
VGEEDTTTLSFGLLSLILVVQVESVNPPVILLAKLIFDLIKLKDLQFDKIAALVLTDFAKLICVAIVG